MSLEVVKNSLIEKFNKPLEDFYNRRIVFWQDEDSEFVDSVDELELENVKIIKATETNNFEIKKLLTKDDLDSDYLVYNNIKYNNNEEDNWLLDIQLYSEEFSADYFSIKMSELNIARNLKSTIRQYKKFLENKERVATLSNMGRKYTSQFDLITDITSVLCGLKEGSSQGVIKAVLSSGMDIATNECLVNIKKFGNMGAFWYVVERETGYKYDNIETLNDFAIHLLLTAVSQNIGTNGLKGLEKYVNEYKQSYCYSLVNDWINGLERDNILKIARAVEEECGLVKRFETLFVDNIDVLAKANVFPCVNEIIISGFLNEIRRDIVKSELILDINGSRRTSSWIEFTESYFDCLYNIAKIQEYTIANVGGYHDVKPEKLVEFYITNGYKMDTYYRKFYLAYGSALNSENEELKDLLKEAKVYVDDLYETVYLSQINRSWLNATKNDLGTLGYVSEVPKQRGFYSKYVKSEEVKNSKVFVLVSDALRYEVAVQLKDELILKTNGKATIEAMQSILPSVTSFGMSALLPHKEISVKNSDKGLSVLVDGNSADSKEKREAILKAENKNSIALKYTDLYNMKSQERRDLTTGIEVVYIYHDTIDAIGDKQATESKVFEACEDAITELTNAVRFITNDMNGTNIFITADHGFLYTHKPLSETDKISKSNIDGEIYELGRRYALASSGSQAEYLTKVELSNEIKGLDMVAYTPMDIVRIKKSGGGENFVHGGMSLQEMIVPVIAYKNLRSSSKQFKAVENVELEVVNMSRKISNMIFNIEFFQKSPVGGKVQACNYSVYFIDSVGSVVSDRHTIIADLGSVNNEDRRHKVRFNLKTIEFSKEETYKLVISNLTNDKDVPVEIGYTIDIPLNMDNDFDFNFGE